MGFIRVDAETGEILAKQKRFSKVMDDSLIGVAADKDITALGYRCLLLMIAKMDYDNVARIRQNDMVKLLGASQAKVSVALKVLAAKSYITIDNSRRPQVYRVSQTIAQRGTKKAPDAC